MGDYEENGWGVVQRNRRLPLQSGMTDAAPIGSLRGYFASLQYRGL